MRNLSETDRKILAVAQLDADAPIRDIAKQLKVREHTVRYALSKLEENGVISRLVYVNLYRVGFVEYQFFLRLAKGTPEEERKLMDTLLTSERVCWLVRLGGSYPIGVAFMAQSPGDATFFLDKLVEQSGVEIAERVFLVIAGRSYFGVKHLAPEPPSGGIVDMGTINDEGVEWEELDHHILHAFAGKNISSSASLARAIGKPESTVQYRLKSLRERGILSRAVYLVNPHAYGMSPFRLRIRVPAPTAMVREKIHAWARSHPNILSFVHCLGPWDFECRVEVSDPKDSLAVAQSLTKTAGASVASTEIVPALEVKRLLHYPFKGWPERRKVF